MIIDLVMKPYRHALRRLDCKILWPRIRDEYRRHNVPLTVARAAFRQRIALNPAWWPLSEERIVRIIQRLE